MNKDNKPDLNIESALQEHLKKRSNQKFIYRKEFFFPLIEGKNKTLDKIKITGEIDEEKYENLLKNYNN
jgi:hypothetical protein